MKRKASSPSSSPTISPPPELEPRLDQDALDGGDRRTVKRRRTESALANDFAIMNISPSSMPIPAHIPIPAPVAALQQEQQMRAEQTSPLPSPPVIKDVRMHSSSWYEPERDRTSSPLFSPPFYNGTEGRRNSGIVVTDLNSSSDEEEESSPKLQPTILPTALFDPFRGPLHAGLPPLPPQQQQALILYKPLPLPSSSSSTPNDDDDEKEEEESRTTQVPVMDEDDDAMDVEL